LITGTTAFAMDVSTTTTTNMDLPEMAITGRTPLDCHFRILQCLDNLISLFIMCLLYKNIKHDSHDLFLLLLELLPARKSIYH
jgi:hypothetical protein